MFRWGRACLLFWAPARQHTCYWTATTGPPTQTHTHSDYKKKNYTSKSLFWVEFDSEMRSSYPNSAKLARQVQWCFSCVVHYTRVGLVLQQHLRLAMENTNTSEHIGTHGKSSTIHVSVLETKHSSQSISRPTHTGMQQFTLSPTGNLESTVNSFTHCSDSNCQT